jgi:hypothetical protein
MTIHLAHLTYFIRFTHFTHFTRYPPRFHTSIILPQKYCGGGFVFHISARYVISSLSLISTPLFRSPLLISDIYKSNNTNPCAISIEDGPEGRREERGAK